MDQTLKISLNEDWRYYYTTQNDDFSQSAHDDSEWEWLSFNELSNIELSPSGVVWLHKRFTLNPSEACIRYFLRCEKGLYPMEIYLRGKLIAKTKNDESIDIEVTNYLSLDDNVLVLAIEAEKWNPMLGQSGLYLQPILCDDLE